MDKRLVVSLVILSIIAASGVAIGSLAETAFGEISVTDYMISRSNGRMVTFSVYQPVESPSFSMPVILTIHGISGSREAMLGYNIELARRNFTVVSVDLPGHGVSSETFGFDTFFEGVIDAYYAVEYVQSTIPNIHSDIYGVLGHSLGAGISLLFQELPTAPNATIIIGGGMGDDFGGLELPLNETNPRNLMIASGIWDELVTVETAYETLRQATGMDDVEENTIYGSFATGTARKLVLSNTNHLFEISDPRIISESIDWFVHALQPTGQIDRTLDPSNQIHQISTGFGLVSIASFVFTIIPLVGLTYEPLKTKMKMTYEEDKILSNIEITYHFSLITSLLGSTLFLLVVLGGFGFDFSGLSPIRVSFGSGLLLFSMGEFVLINRLLGRSYPSHSEAIESSRDWKGLIMKILRGYALLLPVMVWVVSWSVGTQVFLGAKVGFTLQILSGGAVPRLVATFLMALAFIPLFYVDTKWIGSLVNKIENLRDGFKITAKALIHRLGGYVLLLAVLYLPFLLGFPLGFIMFIALLMVPFLLIFGVSVVLLVWLKSMEIAPLHIAMLNALLLAIVVGSTFQLI